MPPFMLINTGKSVGDYQILFDLKPLFDFKTYSSEEEQEMKQTSDADISDYITMVLSKDVFKDLCDLYPETEKTLKWRALDRRHYFLKHMQDQEREYAVGRNKKGLRD